MEYSRFSYMGKKSIELLNIEAIPDPVERKRRLEEYKQKSSKPNAMWKFLRSWTDYPVKL